MTQCEKCGNTIIEGATFCTNCGAPVPVNNTPNDNLASTVNDQMGQPAMQPNIQPAMTPGAQSPSNGTQPNNLASTMPDVTNEKEAKKEKRKFLVPIIAMSAISVICLIVGIAGIIIGLNGNNSGGGSTGGSTGGSGGSSGNVVTPPYTGGDNGGNSGSGSGDGVSQNATQVQIDKYEITIPSDFEYLAETNYITIVPSSQPTWAAQIEYSEAGTYAQVESGVDNIIQEGGTEIAGMTSTGSYIEVGGTKYPCLDIYDPTHSANTTTVFSKAGLYVIMGTVMNKDGSKPSAENVETVANILATAKQKKELNRSAYGDASDQDIQRIQNKILQNFSTK